MTTATLTRFKTVAAPEAAYALRQALGPTRAWADVLPDMIRRRTDYYGLVLLPIARVKDRCGRPVYGVRELIDFIKAALHRASLHHASPGPNARKIATLEIDVPTSDLGVSWRYRRATRVTPKPAGGAT